MRSLIPLIALSVFLGCSKSDNRTSNTSDSDRILVSTDSFKIINATTGALELAKESYIQNAYPPRYTVDNNTLYQARSTNLLSVDLTSGRQKILTPFSSSELISQGEPSWPVIEGNNIYTTGVYDNSTQSVRLFCLNKQNGSKIWMTDDILSYQGTGVTYVSVPAVSSDKIVVTSKTGAATSTYGIYCFNKATGARLWNKNSTTEYINASHLPFIYNNSVVILITRGLIYGFDINTGNSLWTMIRPSSFEYSTELISYNNEVLLTSLYTSPSGFSIIRIDPFTGNINGSTSFPNKSFAAFKDGYVYSNDANTFEIFKTDINNNIIWSAPTINYGLTPVITDKYLYYIYFDNLFNQFLSKYNINTGALINTVNIHNQAMVTQFTVVDSTGKFFSPPKSL
jgi:outer membrane protein assembly factor BamB